MDWSRRTTIIAAIVWMLAAVYASRFMYRGWIPHDEGTIGQSAERVLAGEIPHRDFDEVYTGGLTYLHAAAMAAGGVNLRTPRVVLFVFHLAFLAAVWFIARRVSTPFVALVALALCAVWSTPSYFASLPSWYNLFFATFGVLALLRFTDAHRYVWLIVAGACGGLSVLMKISGAAFLIAGCLFLIFVAQSAGADGVGRLARSRPRWWWWGGATLASAIGLAMLKPTSGLVALVLPLAAIGLFLSWRQRQIELTSGGSSLGLLLRLAAAFLGGAIVPLTLFAVYFALHGALDDLLRGVFVLPLRRLEEASLHPPGIVTLGLAVPYAVMFVPRWPIAHEKVLAGVIAAMGVGGLIMAYQSVPYRLAWAFARELPAVAVFGGLWVLTRREPSTRVTLRTQEQVLLLVAMAACVSLVQFPYATPTYFCYAAPMTAIALAAVVSAQCWTPRRMHLAVAAFLFAFAVMFANRSYGSNLGASFFVYDASEWLLLDRAGLKVPKEDKITYEMLIAEIRRRAGDGALYAGPDCPELYFLSGYQNPTRTIFEFLSPDADRNMSIEAVLDRAAVRVVVINTEPLFSPTMSDDHLRVLERRFPSSVRFGRFELRF